MLRAFIRHEHLPLLDESARQTPEMGALVSPGRWEAAKALFFHAKGEAQFGSFCTADGPAAAAQQRNGERHAVR